MVTIGYLIAAMWFSFTVGTVTSQAVNDRQHEQEMSRLVCVEKSASLQINRDLPGIQFMQDRP